MSDLRKKPGWVFWMAVALILALAYPLSWGPWCFYCGVAEPLWHTGPPGDCTARGFYLPISHVMRRLPESIADGYRSYLSWWYAEGVHYQMWHPQSPP